MKSLKKSLQKKKLIKFFLVTEEKNYLNFFKKKFPNKIININCCYRSDKNDAFEEYPRNLHRYKLGREALLETLLLSKCDYFIYLNSNISSAALSFNLNNNQKRIEINNGMNSKKYFGVTIFMVLKINFTKKIRRHLNKSYENSF